MKQGANVIKTF